MLRTGLDEAFIIGTKEELANFAHSILRLLEEPQRHIDFHGILTNHPKVKTSLSEPMSEIVLDSIVIVESQEARRKLTNEIRKNNGVTPIDWEAYDTNKSDNSKS